MKQAITRRNTPEESPKEDLIEKLMKNWEILEVEQNKLILNVKSLNYQRNKLIENKIYVDDLPEFYILVQRDKYWEAEILKEQLKYNQLSKEIQDQKKNHFYLFRKLNIFSNFQEQISLDPLRALEHSILDSVEIEETHQKLMSHFKNIRKDIKEKFNLPVTSYIIKEVFKCDESVITRIEWMLPIIVNCFILFIVYIIFTVPKILNTEK